MSPHLCRVAGNTVIPYGTWVPVAVWRLRSANCYIRVTLLTLLSHTSCIITQQANNSTTECLRILASETDGCMASWTTLRRPMTIRIGCRWQTHPRDALHRGERAANKIRWTLSVICDRTKLATLGLRVESRQFHTATAPAFNPTCIWRLRWRWPRLSFAEVFGTRKLKESLGYRVALFAWSYV